jgi:hypothetical protein
MHDILEGYNPVSPRNLPRFGIGPAVPYDLTLAEGFLAGRVPGSAGPLCGEAYCIIDGREVGPHVERSRAAYCAKTWQLSCFTMS